MAGSSNPSHSPTPASFTSTAAVSPDYVSDEKEKYEKNVEGLSPEDVKVARRALWKMDFAIIPIVAMYYLLSFLDRS